ncbi:lipoprotein-releasing ABC transporter permease subunit LolE, partial [Vibrio campbellii]
RELQNRVLSVVPHAELEGVRGPLDNWQQVAERAEMHPDVEAAAPYVTLTALAEKGQEIKAIEVRGMDLERESRVSTLASFVDPQAWQQFVPGNQQIILGSGVARQLGLDV